MNNTLDNPFYYLKHFDTVLAWVHGRYFDLLDHSEIKFIENFTALPTESRALFVRMVMRKGSLFRASKLNYEEISDVQTAIKYLIELGWVEYDPLITIKQLFAVLTKKEIAHSLELSHDKAVANKLVLLEWAQAEFKQIKPFSAWYPVSADILYEIIITTLCDRIRLMFFGNLRQEWSEFVLSDLNIFIYEKVVFSPTSRSFNTRHEVDDYIYLHDCQQRFY
ncbi:MAG: hypothetical protein ABIR84_08950 [Candidatus Nitrotoga sp.]